MNRKEELAQSLSRVRAELSEMTDRAIQLVVVTKTYPVEDLLLLYELGVRDFGENRVQELAEKAPQLPDDVRFHMIGSLQSNKINALLPHVHMLQSLDRVSLAKALGKRLKKPLDTLLEINIADDANKQGMDPEEIPAVLAAVKPFPLLRVRGMMVMGSHTDDDSVIREDFKRANQLFASLKKEENEQVRMEILSMGMSGDYRIAAQEGASMRRVGSAILGERS